MDDSSISLTAGFSPPDETAWRALVDKTLNGAPFAKRLISKTYDGIEIQPLYTPADGQAALRPELRRRGAFDADRYWDIRAGVDHPDPKEASRHSVEDLEGGATSVLLKIDPTGFDGVAIGAQADLALALDGVLLDLAPVALDAGYLGPVAAGWLSAIAQTKTLRPHLYFHLDPISTLARTGASPGPITAHIARAAQVCADLPSTGAFLASGQAAHEAGATDAQEIAFAASAGLTYVKALTAAGVTVKDAFDRTVLGVAADGDYFSTIAKFRAARAVWARIGDVLGVADPSIKLEGRTSRRMLSTLDPWVNMLRLTAAAFGASLGGADAIVLDPFTQPLGRPTDFARRQARNVQLVLMEEAHLGRVSDPAGGSWYIEHLTDALARAAWSRFQRMEGEGGVLGALSKGSIAAEIKSARDARASDVAKRKAGLVGVSEFANLLGAEVQIDPVDHRPFVKGPPDVRQPGADDQCQALAPWRLSEGFEALRARAKAMAVQPQVFLATIGGINDFSGRVGFCRNALAAGGLEALVGKADDFDPLKTPLAIVCGSDAGYAERAVSTLASLKQKGALSIFLAGRPGELEPLLKAAGLTGSIFAGADLEEALTGMLNVLIHKA